MARQIELKLRSSSTRGSRSKYYVIVIKMSASHPNKLSATPNLQEGAERQWPVGAVTRTLELVTTEGDLSAELEEQVTQFQGSGDAESLINEASGIVATAGLYHTMQGRLSAPELLEATPSPIVNTTAAQSESGNPSSSNSADATEAFCLDFDSSEPQGRLPDAPEEVLPSGRPLTLTLQRLIDRAQAGDAYATDKIVTLCEPLALGIIARNNWFVKGGQTVDLCQEALIGAADAINGYDSTKGNFRNFAVLVMKRKMLTAIVGSNCRKHALLNDAVSLYEPPNGDEEAYNLEETIPSSQGLDVTIRLIYKEALRELLPIFRGKLSELEYICITMYAEGFSYAEIAGTAQCDFKGVDNALARVKRKIPSDLRATVIDT